MIFLHRHRLFAALFFVMEQYEKSPLLWLRCDCKEHDLFLVRAQVSWHMAAPLLCKKVCGSAVYSGLRETPWVHSDLLWTLNNFSCPYPIVSPSRVTLISVLSLNKCVPPVPAPEIFFVIWVLKCSYASLMIKWLISLCLRAHCSTEVLLSQPLQCPPQPPLLMSHLMCLSNSSALSWKAARSHLTTLLLGPQLRSRCTPL